MFGLGLILTAAYIPGWTGATVLSGWVVLSILLPFYLIGRLELGLGHWLGLSFLAYATASYLWAPVPAQAVWDLWLTWCLAFSFALGAERYDPKLWVGMAVGLIPSLAFAFAQWLGYSPIFANNYISFAGTFVNPDMFGETACLVTIALIASRCYWPLVFTIPPIYFAQSRTVIVAYAAVIAFAAWERWRWMVVLPSLLLMLSVGWWVSRNTADRPHHSDAIAERFAIWRDTLDGVTWLGRGPGSFYMLYPEFAKRTDTMATRPEDPHNEYLNLAFQYGLGALPLAGLLWLGLASRGPERYILIAFLTIAFFSFPTRIPTEGFVGLVALGRLCRRGNLAWVHQLLGGPRSDGRAPIRRRKDRTLESLRPNKARV